MDGNAKVVCESCNKPRYGHALACFSLTLSGETSLLFIITIHGVAGIGVAVGTSAGVPEAAGMRVSVGILAIVSMAVAGRVLALVLVGMTIPEEVGKAGIGGQSGI